MSTREEIARQALALPAADRLFVAEALDRSFLGDGFANPEIAEAWLVEMERRLAEYERGEVQAIPGNVVLDQLRERLAERRAKKART